MGPKNIAKYLDLAMKTAQKRPVDELYIPDYSMGCVVVMGSKIVAQGINEPFNAIAHRIMDEYQVQKDYISVHAEIKAITMLKSIKNAWIFVNGYATKSRNHLACSRPCPNCEEILSHLGARAISWVENGNNVTMFPKRKQIVRS
jgi:tRNA(Arg) A34 adenosine deaminase TadA